MKPGHAVAISLIIAGLAMILVLNNGLVYDAVAILVRDPRLATPIDWAGLVTERYWGSGLWRPLTLSVLGVESAIGGDKFPIIFHFTSLLLYLVTTGLIVRLVLRFGTPPAAALVAGAIFAAHPIHVEVVASVVGQAELLTAMAMLVAAWRWHHASLAGFSVGTLVTLLLAQAVAIGSKEQGFVLPLLLVGQHLLMPTKMSHREAARFLVPVGLLAVMLLIVRASITGSIAGETPALFLASLSTPARWATALGVLPEIIRLFFFPLHLQAEYGPPGMGVMEWTDLQVVFGIVVVTVWAVAIWKWRKAQPMASLGLFWIAVTWFPASSILSPAGTILAERLLFLPSVGFALVIGSLAGKIAWYDRRMQGALLVVVCLLIGRSVQRTTVWRDEQHFFAQMTKDAPDVYRAWYIRGVGERSVGNLEAAEQHQGSSLELWRRDPIVFEELGQLLRAGGRCEEAIPILTEGLSVEPTRTQLRSKLGECLLTTGDSLQAAELAREGVNLGDESFKMLLERSGLR